MPDHAHEEVDRETVAWALSQRAASRRGSRMHQMVHSAQARLTHLSRLHPYPAMVADELALDLASEYIPTGGSILDPFCGSGRLLAAANCASVRVGVDSNPLAWLLTRAKLSPARTKVIGEIL